MGIQEIELSQVERIIRRDPGRENGGQHQRDGDESGRNGDLGAEERVQEVAVERGGEPAFLPQRLELQLLDHGPHATRRSIRMRGSTETESRSTTRLMVTKMPDTSSR